MINPKQYLTDTILKIDGVGEPHNEESRKRADEFMRELIANTSQHPLNNKARIIGNAHVVIEYDGDGVRIKDIQSHEPGSGAGTRALQYLVKLSEKHKVPLNLYAKGYTSTKTNQLKNWYKRFGFEPDESGAQEMTRKP